MKRSRQSLFLGYFFCLVCLSAGVYLQDGLRRAFQSNPLFNSLILVTLITGVGTSLWLLHRLSRAAHWLSFSERATSPTPPSLLAPLEPFVWSTSSTPRSAIDAVLVELEDARDLTRYLMNSLILLGLLGTFWGLLQTVAGIGSVIGGLSLGGGDVTAVFDQFKDSLQRPLSGMGVSFSASLFGLASSLIIGFLDLLAGRSQSSVAAKLESTFSAVIPAKGEVQTFAGLTAPFSPTPPALQEAIIQAIAEQLERVERALRQQIEMRQTEQASTRTLQELLARLEDHFQGNQSLLTTLVALTQHTTPLLEQIATVVTNPAQAALEHHVRSIDLSVRDLSRLVMSAAENQTEELRNELRILARLLSQPQWYNSASQNG